MLAQTVVPSALVAEDEGALGEYRDVLSPVAFREKGWIPGVTIFIDVVTVETALLFGYLTRYALSPWWPIHLSTVTLSGLSIGLLVLPLSYFLAGLHPGYGLGDVERLRRRLSITVFVFGVLLVWDYVVQSGSWSRGITLATLVFVMVLTPLLQALSRGYLIRKGLWGTPVVLAGAGETGTMIARILRAEPQLGFVPVGFMDDTEPKGMEVENLPVLGHVEQANGLADDIDTVILTMPGAGSRRLAQLTQGLRFPRIIVIPNLFELPSLWVKPRDFGGVLGLEIQQNLLIRRNQVIKRISDYVLAVPIFLVALPLVAGAAICIKIASPGPAFFKQERDGLNGRKFRMWKLRTMYLDAEYRMESLFRKSPAARQQWQSHAKIENDPRIIPMIGSWLRKSSIDELPQLWNVLRGDMSLIGPRPFVDYHLTLFSGDFRQFRTKVCPGITGLWQVLMRNDGDIRSQETLDTYYVRNWSLWLDLYILLRTIPVVIAGKGAR